MTVSDSRPADFAEPSLRVATFNASLNRGAEGALVNDLSTSGNAQAATIAEIIQRVAPDVLLVNEFDYVAKNRAADLFRANYLEQGQNRLNLPEGAAPIEFPYAFTAPSNTGIASGFDLNNNGQAVTTPGAPGYGDDALGFGNFPGQFGMAIFSKYPILTDQVRTFQTFLWKDMPGALLPDNAGTPAPADWYSPEELAVFRLASKSVWDVPVLVDGAVVHIIVGHPTPPVFDGPEDRNGLRNHDEIRFIADYVTPGQGDYIYDDKGVQGGLEPGARFVIMGDMNADPFDGDSVDQAAQLLLDNPVIDSRLVPTSAGGPEQAALQGGANATHQGDPIFDTADFADGTPGNLRVDYVLPSEAGLAPRAAGVFWPERDDPLFPLVGTFNPTLPGGFPSSDHKLVWMDLGVTGPADFETTVENISFLGEADIAFDASLGGLRIGGLSSITYDAARDRYYVLSDDATDPRFYTARIRLGDGELSDGDVRFKQVRTLNDQGTPYPANQLDPEGLAYDAARKQLYFSSEGFANQLIAPEIDTFSLQGRLRGELEVPDLFLPTADQSSGIRNNLAFEALTLTPDGQTLYVGAEGALYQDGPAATPGNGTLTRILTYDTATNQPGAQYVYQADPVTDPPVPAGQFALNGVVELLALDNEGTLLVMERSFSVGVGYDIKVYLARTQDATDVSGLASLAGESYVPVQKTLLFDLADFGIVADNVEGMTFGRDLADGRKTLVMVSDNNFNPAQTTQFLAFALDVVHHDTVLI